MTQHKSIFLMFYVNLKIKYVGSYWVQSFNPPANPMRRVLL